MLPPAPPGLRVGRILVHVPSCPVDSLGHDQPIVCVDKLPEVVANGFAVGIGMCDRPKRFQNTRGAEFRQRVVQRLVVARFAQVVTQKVEGHCDQISR